MTYPHCPNCETLREEIRELEHRIAELNEALGNAHTRAPGTYLVQGCTFPGCPDIATSGDFCAVHAVTQRR